VIESFGAKLTLKEKSDLLESFPGMEGADQQIRINIARIYD